MGTFSQLMQHLAFPLCPSLARTVYVSQSTLSSVPAWTLHWEGQGARASMLQADTEAWLGEGS